MLFIAVTQVTQVLMECMDGKLILVSITEIKVRLVLFPRGRAENTSVLPIRVNNSVMTCKFCDAGSALQLCEQNMQICISSLTWSLRCEPFLVNSADQCARRAHILRGAIFLWMRSLERPKSEHWDSLPSFAV